MQLDLPVGSRVADAWDRLVARAAGLGPLRGLVRTAVGEEYCAWDQVLSDGDEVAFIPPTAGG